jgi:hypothetical protein
MKASKFFALKNIQGNEIDFHRNKYDGINYGTHCKRGVYFWGFYLGDKFRCIPEKAEDILIYYIGKEQGNVSQRIMQEFTQLIIGGFGTIIHHEWLKKHQFDADIYNKQVSDKKQVSDNKKGILAKEVLYKSYGLHVLHDFYYNSEIRLTINWMFERLIFAWINEDDKSPIMMNNFEETLSAKLKSDLKAEIQKKTKYKPENENQQYLDKIKNLLLAAMESEFHHIVGRNILGGGQHPPNLKDIKDASDKIVTPLFNNVDWTENEILKNWILETNKRLIDSQKKASTKT